MDVISSKVRNINIYQAKACHQCLYKSFLIFNNHLQKLHLPPKNFNENCSNRGIVRKFPRALILKKIVNSTRNCLLTCDTAVMPLHKRFSRIHQTAIILNDKTKCFLFHTQKKYIYIHWTLSTDIPIFKWWLHIKKIQECLSSTSSARKKCELRQFRIFLKNYANFIFQLMSNP